LYETSRWARAPHEARASARALRLVHLSLCVLVRAAGEGRKEQTAPVVREVDVLQALAAGEAWGDVRGAGVAELVVAEVEVREGGDLRQVREWRRCV
jgi:hypothetical protein